MVLPFVALSLLPQGFMPDRDASGALVVVLCTPDGPINMVTGEGEEGASRAPCHWSLAHAAVLPVQPVTLPLPPQDATLALTASTADLWRPAYDPLGIWARGPPALI